MKASSNLGQSILLAGLLVVTSIGVILVMALANSQF